MVRMRSARALCCGGCEACARIDGGGGGVQCARSDAGGSMRGLRARLLSLLAVLALVLGDFSGVCCAVLLLVVVEVASVLGAVGALVFRQTAGVCGVVILRVLLNLLGVLVAILLFVLLSALWVSDPVLSLAGQDFFSVFVVVLLCVYALLRLLALALHFDALDGCGLLRHEGLHDVLHR